MYRFEIPAGVPEDIHGAGFIGAAYHHNRNLHNLLAILKGLRYDFRIPEPPLIQGPVQYSRDTVAPEQFAAGFCVQISQRQGQG